MNEQILGVIGSAISSVIWWPQAVRVWRLRNHPSLLEGVSVWTLGLQAANALVWFAYAYAASAFWAGAPGMLTLPLVAFIGFIAFRSHRRSKVHI